MTDRSLPLPDAGGSFIRQEDGTLVPPPAVPAPAADPEPEPVQDRPAGKTAKQAVKEA